MQSRVPHGFTLIDVLAALLVLAVGVLAAAGTELASLRTRHGSALLSDGVRLAGALAERMRANSAGVDDARNPYLRLAYDAAGGAPPGAPPCHTGAACSSAELAAHDLNETMQAVYRGFPGGRVRVCRDAAASMDWRCSGGPGDPLVVKLGWLRRTADGGWASGPALVMVADGGAP